MLLANKSDSRLIYGFGINDAPAKTRQVTADGQTYCPFYRCWQSMIRRCYSKNELNRKATYQDCNVSPEWKRLSVFSEWMATQRWQGMHLDKDLIGDGKLYSPKNCVFISQQMNKFMNDHRAARGMYPIGVYRDPDGRFRARVSVGGKYRSLGRFACPLDAHAAWVVAKTELALTLAGQEPDERVALGLRRYASSIAQRK